MDFTYADNLHRTVRWAIRKPTLTIIEPYLRQLVGIQSAYYGVPPALAPGATALYLTHGVGCAVLHEDSATYLQNHVEIKKGTSLLMGMPTGEQERSIAGIPASQIGRAAGGNSSGTIPDRHGNFRHHLPGGRPAGRSSAGAVSVARFCRR